MSADLHYLECARAAYAILIERATTHSERRELRRELAEIESRPTAQEAVMKVCPYCQIRLRYIDDGISRVWRCDACSLEIETDDFDECGGSGGEGRSPSGALCIHEQHGEK